MADNSVTTNTDDSSTTATVTAGGTTPKGSVTISAPAPTPAEVLNTEPGAADDPEQHMVPRARLNEVLAELKALKGAAEKAAKAQAEAERRALEEQSRFKELYEAELSKVQAAEAKAQQLEHDALRRSVATEAGYPGLWNRISGADADELMADLKTLLQGLPDNKKPAPVLDGGAGSAARKGEPVPASEDQMRAYAARFGLDPSNLDPVLVGRALAK